MKYRKKPVVVEAIQWFKYEASIIGWLIRGGADYIVFPDMRLRLRTLEGNMDAEPGDWIIKSIKGEFYPCKPDIFEATYELVEEED